MGKVSVNDMINTQMTNTGMTNLTTSCIDITNNESISKRFGALFKFANITLSVSLTLLIICIAVSYPLSHLFSMRLQVASHLMIIVSASVLKVAYVVRCIAQYEQHKQHKRVL